MANTKTLPWTLQMENTFLEFLTDCVQTGVRPSSTQYQELSELLKVPLLALRHRVASLKTQWLKATCMTVPLEAEGLDYFFRPNFALLNAFFSGCNEGVPVPARENLRLVALPGEDQFMEKDTFVCRVCLVRDPSSIMRSLADKQTRELLIKCTSITITPGDKYPQQMCLKCWIKCKSCCAFQKLARDSDWQLRWEEEQEEVGNGDAVKVKEEVVDEEEESIQKVKEEVRDGEEEISAKKGPLEEELVQKDRDLQLRLKHGEENMCEREEEVIVKEEAMEEDEIRMDDTEDQLDYLQGYSLATESEGEKDAIPLTGKSVGIRRSTRQKKATVGPSVIKANKCKICAKAFIKLEGLKAHIRRVHENEGICQRGAKKFNCDKCDTKCRTLSELVQHKLLNHNIKFYECDKTFKRMKELRDDQVTHSEPFQCDKCDWKFARNCKLTRHKKTHLAEEPFKCSFCFWESNSKGCLTRHLNSQHKIYKAT